MIEDFIKIMREEGANNNPPGIELAVMTGPLNCSIGSYNLDREDLLFMDYLLHPIATKVLVNDSFQDQSIYTPALKAGDTVAVIKNGNKYLVLGKVADV